MEAKFFIWCFTEESLICFRTGGVWSRYVMGLLSYCSLLYRVAGHNLQKAELILHILSRINYNSRNPAHTYSSECWRLLLNFSEKIPEYCYLAYQQCRCPSRRRHTELGVNWIQEYSAIPAARGSGSQHYPTAPTSGRPQSLIWALGHSCGKPRYPRTVPLSRRNTGWSSLADSISCKELKDLSSLHGEAWWQGVLDQVVLSNSCIYLEVQVKGVLWEAELNAYT